MLKKKHKIIILSVILILTSLFLSIKLVINQRYVDNNEEMMTAYLNNEEAESIDSLIGILSIPTIQLKRGFYSITSTLNDVSKNIQVIEDNMDNMLILAAHRGNSPVSFFNDLEKLSLGDEIFLDYHHQSYKYILYYKYYEDKDGNLPIRYDNTKQVLVLITCVKELKDKQVIYIAYKI